jgi:CHAD domain-containing protein
MPETVANLHLTRDLSAGRAGKAIVLACSADIDRGLKDLMTSDSIEGPHATRVALRQLRTALKAFEPILDPKRVTPIRERAKTAFRDIGKARDADVLVEGIGSHLPPGDAQRLRASATAARKLMRQSLKASGADQIGADLRRLFAGNDWKRRNKQAMMLRKGPVRRFARMALDQAWQLVLQNGQGLEQLSSGARHEFRKRIKTLRYLVDFFDELWDPSAVQRFLVKLKIIQEQLGVLNDLAQASAGPDLPATVLAQQSATESLALKRAVTAWNDLQKAGTFW